MYIYTRLYAYAYVHTYTYMCLYSSIYLFIYIHACIFEPSLLCAGVSHARCHELLERDVPIA